MLIKMVDGGLVNYTDDYYSYGGCPTCDYGSEYITEIDITLTQYKIHIKTNQMYEYVISEGQMMALFLSEYNTIQAMTEKEFVDWFKAKLCEITHDEFQEGICGRQIEEFKVVKIEEEK
jgi:hypothetical protein